MRSESLHTHSVPTLTFSDWNVTFHTTDYYLYNKFFNIEPFQFNQRLIYSTKTNIQRFFYTNSYQSNTYTQKQNQQNHSLTTISLNCIMSKSKTDIQQDESPLKNEENQENPSLSNNATKKSKESNEQTTVHTTVQTTEEIEQKNSIHSNHPKRKKRYTKNSFGRPFKNNKFQRTDEGNPTNDKNKKNIRKDNPEDRNQPPHDGSFASPVMQTLHGVQIKNNNNNNNDDDDDENQDDNDEYTKRPKKKVALLIGFKGTNYAGMQINKEQKSLQAYIELALYQSNYIAKSNFGHPSKYSWSNSARTDKGVHSCAQVCSCKLTIGPNDLYTTATTKLPDISDALTTQTKEEEETETNIIDDDINWDIIRENINQNLPSDIQILDIIRTTKKFCAKSQRNKVRYQYLIPSFVLQDHLKLREFFESKGISHPLVKNRDTYLNPFTEQTFKEDLLPHFVKYRASNEELKRLQHVLNAFNGTHLYHNYTNGKTGSDPSSRRYIMDASITINNDNNIQNQNDTIPTIIDQKSGMEWIPISIMGQSFLLHQIRKMMTMTIDVTRQYVDEDVLHNSLNRQTQMILSIAPAQGLFLDMSYFDSYNKKKEVQSKAFSRLDWHSHTKSNSSQDQTSNISNQRHDAAKNRWNSFKHNVVINHIMEEEVNEGNFAKYIYWQEFAVDRNRYFPSKTLPNPDESLTPED